MGENGNRRPPLFLPGATIFFPHLLLPPSSFLCAGEKFTDKVRRRFSSPYNRKFICCLNCCCLNDLLSLEIGEFHPQLLSPPSGGEKRERGPFLKSVSVPPPLFRPPRGREKEARAYIPRFPMHTIHYLGRDLEN